MRIFCFSLSATGRFCSGTFDREPLIGSFTIHKLAYAHKSQGRGPESEARALQRRKLCTDETFF
jgi:hypothetical protein